MRRIPALAVCAVLSVLALSASGCSLVGDDDDSADNASGRVVLVTHESFALPKKLIEQFEADTGYDLVVRAAGDAGTLTNKLVLTRDHPTGDVAFGVDNTFGSRALDEDVFEPYDVKLQIGRASCRERV